jgi:transcriptional regulator with XRE-family HTH domain
LYGERHHVCQELALSIELDTVCRVKGGKVVSEVPARDLTVLGEFIRNQRHMSNLSLRQLSAMAAVSNAYLSQIERGLHAPSVRVLQSIAMALNLSAEVLFAQAGLITEPVDTDDGATEAAIRADSRLTPQQKQALLSVYRTYIEANS